MIKREDVKYFLKDETKTVVCQELYFNLLKS